jgi:hypothetical protein
MKPPSAVPIPLSRGGACTPRATRVVLSEDPLPRSVAPYGGEQSLLFIEAQGVCGQAGQSADLAE